MKPPPTLDATIPCDRCQSPVTVSIPVAFATHGTQIQVTFDRAALQLAVTAHVKQHLVAS